MLLVETPKSSFPHVAIGAILGFSACVGTIFLWGGASSGSSMLYQTATINRPQVSTSALHRGQLVSKFPAPTFPSTVTKNGGSAPMQATTTAASPWGETHFSLTRSMGVCLIVGFAAIGAALSSLLTSLGRSRCQSSVPPMVMMATTGVEGVLSCFTKFSRCDCPLSIRRATRRVRMRLSITTQAYQPKYVSVQNAACRCSCWL